MTFVTALETDMFLFLHIAYFPGVASCPFLSVSGISVQRGSTQTIFHILLFVTQVTHDTKITITDICTLIVGDFMFSAPTNPQLHALGHHWRNLCIIVRDFMFLAPGRLTSTSPPEKSSRKTCGWNPHCWLVLVTGSWIISISVQFRLVHFSRTIPHAAAQYLLSRILESIVPKCNY